MRFTENDIFQEAKKIAKKYAIIKAQDLYTKLIHNPEELRGWYDIDDPRDYSFEEIAGAEIEIEESVDLSSNLSKIQNQGLEVVTRMMCTAYSPSHGSDILWVDNTKHFHSGKQIGLAMHKAGKLGLNSWAYIIDGVKFGKALNLLDGYSNARQVHEMKQALSIGRPICVWSRTIDWRKTRANNNIAVPWSAYWHAFLVIWYTKEHIICLNSYWKESNDNGKFYIKWSDFGLLYPNKYVLHLNDEKLTLLGTYVDYFTKEKADKVKRPKSYSKLSVSQRKTDRKIIMLAMRKVWKMNITDSMLIE